MVNSYLAGALSGIIEVTCTHPLDYIKTKTQQKVPIRDILRQTNTSLYYSGYGPRVIGIIPTRLTFWGCQNSMQTLLDRNQIRHWTNFIWIGSVTAYFQTWIDTPIEVMKIAYMNQSICTSSLFKGFYPTLYRNIVFTNCVVYASQHHKSKPLSEQTKTSAFLYAGLGGFIGSVLSQPLDYVKTQKQLPYPDSRSMVTMITQEPIQSLFRGGGLRALLGMSTMSIGYCVYMTCL